MVRPRPIRVLHILGSLNRGGAETWLLHALRQMDRNQVAMDFLVHQAELGVYEDEVRALGSQIHRCLNPQKLWQYGRQFKKLLTEHGPYDTVHSHVHFYSGHTLRIARRCGVPMRIAHSHNDTSHFDNQAGLARRMYLRLMSRWLAKHATHGLAASGKAAVSLFGANWQNDPRFRILFCGVDLEPFAQPLDPNEVRAEFGWTDQHFIVGHVGRFDEQKNHPFLIQIFAEIARQRPEARLLLVGIGDRQSEIKTLVANLGLADRVAFAGTRADVPRLMLGAMDVFALPSLFEGLPLVLVEAQAAGLPCFVSDVIAPETTLVAPLMRQMSLKASPANWAAAILAERPQFSRATAHEIVEQSPLNIQNSARELQHLYQGLAAQELQPRKPELVLSHE
jgi:glycosyltransferase involved in cell wall biosynthesis